VHRAGQRVARCWLCGRAAGPCRHSRRPASRAQVHSSGVAMSGRDRMCRMARSQRLYTTHQRCGAVRRAGCGRRSASATCSSSAASSRRSTPACVRARGSIGPAVRAARCSPAAAVARVPRERAAPPLGQPASATSRRRERSTPHRESAQSVHARLEAMRGGGRRRSATGCQTRGHMRTHSVSALRPMYAARRPQAAQLRMLVLRHHRSFWRARGQLCRAYTSSPTRLQRVQRQGLGPTSSRTLSSSICVCTADMYASSASASEAGSAPPPAGAVAPPAAPSPPAGPPASSSAPSANPAPAPATSVGAGSASGRAVAGRCAAVSPGPAAGRAPAAAALATAAAAASSRRSASASATRSPSSASCRGGAAGLSARGCARSARASLGRAAGAARRDAPHTLITAALSTAQNDRQVKASIKVLNSSGLSAGARITPQQFQ